MRVKLVKGFTQDPVLGNPAGVILNADGLSDQQKQSISAELNFSESAFVEDSKVADFRVRFFTPTQEVGICGHATIATFHTLMAEGIITPSVKAPVKVTQETNVGVLNVTCFFDGKIMMSQKDSEFLEVLKDDAEVANLLGLRTKDLLNLPLQIVSTGGRELIVSVKDRTTLQKINPHLRGITEHSKLHKYAGIAVIAPTGFTHIGDLATRNFAPIVGINEDPATGIAAGAIGWYANKYLFSGRKQSIIVEQGYSMGMGSTILVDISSGTQVGGYGATFGEREL